MVKAVEELRKGHSRLVQMAEWSESDGLLHFCGKIFVLDGKDLCQRIVSQHHDSQVVVHAGRWKTLELVAQINGAADVPLHQSVHEDM